MYVFISSEATLPKYLNCRPLSRSVLLEGILVLCVSQGGTPFVFLVITVLCIATSCVLRKVHSLTYTFKDLLLSAMHVVFDTVKLGCFSFLGW